MEPTASSSPSTRTSARRRPRRSRPQAGGAHAVRFYESEEFLASEVATVVSSALRSEQPVVVIATASHRAAFTARLGALGIDVAEAQSDGRLRLLDAQETLASFMRGRVPDTQAFRASVGGAIEGAMARAPGTTVCAYGELVDLLWKDGNPDGALRVEELWNDLAATHRFSLLCAYAMDNFANASDAARFLQVCRRHSQVSPAEQYTGPCDGAQAIEISVLQQRARALETELAHRQKAELRLHQTLADQQGIQEALARSERHLRDVLENAAEGIHWVGPDGTILWANQAELDMLGHAAEKYIGRHIAEFHVDRDVIDDMLTRLSCGETLREHEARMWHKDGSIRHVLINSNVYRENGAFVHTRCFTRDITPLKEAAAERERLLEREQMARTEAEEANRAKGEFLAVMSHELRTPLNAIAGYADLLEIGVHGPLTSAQRDAIGRIQRSQRHLLGLINQVLNYARVESGSVQYQLAPVVVDDVLRLADALIAPQMSAKGLDYQYRGSGRSVIAYADPERVQQIVLNLFSNAAKFTERGGRVFVECEASEQSVVIRVHDTGIGIPADKLDAVFDPFVQIDTRLTRPQEGVGLGLAISRDLARGMSGDLSAASVPRVGSTFTLTLPRAGRVGSDEVVTSPPRRHPPA